MSNLTRMRSDYHRTLRQERQSEETARWVKPIVSLAVGFTIGVMLNSKVLIAHESSAQDAPVLGSQQQVNK